MSAVFCADCEYRNRCFPLLKFIQRWKDICMQGRKKVQRELPIPKEVKIGNIHAVPRTDTSPPEPEGDR